MTVSLSAQIDTPSILLYINPPIFRIHKLNDSVMIPTKEYQSYVGTSKWPECMLKLQKYNIYNSANLNPRNSAFLSPHTLIRYQIFVHFIRLEPTGCPWQRAPCVKNYSSWVIQYAFLKPTFVLQFWRKFYILNSFHRRT